MPSIFGLLALASIGAVVYSLYQGATGTTHLTLFKAELSTTSVGVAMLAIRLLVAFFTTRAVLNALVKLAAIRRPSP
jgi:hypothetical protein